MRRRGDLHVRKSIILKMSTQIIIDNKNSKTGLKATASRPGFIIY